MAKKRLPNTSNVKTHSFVKGLNKDSDFTYVQDGMWTHARNATNNTIEGNQGTISNASSNQLCATAGAFMPSNFGDRKIIGAIHLFADKWIIYTVGHNATDTATMSEIGLLEDDSCTYRTIVQDACLNFDKRYLIDGASKEMQDCSWQVYWCDNKNPDRFLNIGDPDTWPDSTYTFIGQGNINYYTNGTNDILWPNVTWKEDCSTTGSNCIVCTDLNELDCEKIRITSLVQTPCIEVTPGQSGGTINNGSYSAAIAYTINGVKVTDYFSPSNIQPVWHEDNGKNSLEIKVEADTENFDEFQIALIQTVNSASTAIVLGLYSSSTSRITLDGLQGDFRAETFFNLNLISDVYEKSKQIEDVNSYLVRVAPTTYFDFNYQPLANLIRSKWVSVEYPAEYYINGGHKTSYLRDEVYAFFIRWVYNTGYKSPSFHIPGRAPSDFKIPTSGATVSENDNDPINNDINTLYTGDHIFETYNTASLGTLPGGVPTTLDEGGKIIASGNMGYWQSTEIYDDKKPEVWNSSSHCWTNSTIDENDLCGKYIRHHKFPDNTLSNETMHFKPNPTSSTIVDEAKIRLMGVIFENIPLPKDNLGKDIPGIVGYEILRGSRQGNKSIVAKGMINNYRTFEFKGTSKKGKTGLYANHPFNTIKPWGNTNDPSDYNYNLQDPYLTQQENDDDPVEQKIPSDIISFHSPDTMFRVPYLSTTELKLYGVIKGFSNQSFHEPNQHPKFKLVDNWALVTMITSGLIQAIISMVPKSTYNAPRVLGTGGGQANPVPANSTAALTAATAAQTAVETYNTAFDLYFAGVNPVYGNPSIDVVLGLVGGYGATGAAQMENTILTPAFAAAATAGAIPPTAGYYTMEFPDYYYLDPITRVANGLSQLAFYFSEGSASTLRLIKAILPFRQYALQMMSHGLYSNMTGINVANPQRFKVPDAFYIKNNIQNLPRYQNSLGSDFSYQINNLKRNRNVTLRTEAGPVGHSVSSIGPTLLDEDKSLVTLGTLVQNGTPPIPAPNTLSGDIPTFDDPTNPEFSLPIASYYGGIKFRLKNQYGKLDSILQTVITPCEQKDFRFGSEGPICNSNGKAEEIYLNTISNSSVLFGGDTYINRYTEKNTMLFFNQWLFDFPDGQEYNYMLDQMIPEPKFHCNSQSYDVSNLINEINIFGAVPGNNQGTLPGQGPLPTDFYNLDHKKYKYKTNSKGAYPGVFGVKKSFFYLADSAIRDFYVESDVLIDFRENAPIDIAAKHYDPYRFTDFYSMFDMNPKIITADNVYNYDYSLSITKSVNQKVSAGAMQSRNYDPNVARLCYTTYPNRILYSLPQINTLSYKDSWRIFLLDNLVNLSGEISGVKQFGRSGIFITFNNQSPIMYQGVDTLKTDANRKLTIGDGGLFSQPPQKISSAEAAYEYGSSQDNRSISSSPGGFYYISQNQGKIFSYANGLNEISQNGMKWWFDTFLPYQLLQDFPDYPYLDNPVCGIGCQTLFDNDNILLYFAKKDYKLKSEYTGQVTYDSAKDIFIIKDRKASEFKLGDPELFDDASWTISFDPKSKFFISFHDWHPDLVLPGKNNWITTKNNQLWKHNDKCNDYCKYYGRNYPFELEIPVSTGQNVTTLKSIEYILESYKRAEFNCFDQFHVLDFNFDEAVIYNSEQVSGYLNLNLMPKNNILLSLEYPKYNTSNPSYDILFSKEENKYRFNQFWDITKDRGEFPIGAGYPPTGPVIPGSTVLDGNYNERHIWLTKPNGYIRELNTTNLDYQKSQEQRKRFRHYANFISLKRNISGPVNMVLKMINTKSQISQR